MVSIDNSADERAACARNFSGRDNGQRARACRQVGTQAELPNIRSMGS
jgi:hypothetical protein